MTPATSREDALTDRNLPLLGPALSEFQAILNSIPPWSGRVPSNYLVDGLGIITPAAFQPDFKDQCLAERDAYARLPSIVANDGWFEIVDWLVSAREATGEYVAVSLGAAYGRQLVGAWKALQLVNPLPALLVGVEAEPEYCRWIEQHMRDNGIAPDDHVIIQAAVGPNNQVVLFPVGTPGGAPANCVSTNSPQSRSVYAQELSRPELAGDVVRNLLLRNSTGLAQDLGGGTIAEVKFVSAVTLGDIVGPLRHVDLLEVDIQQSEAEAIPPYLNLLTRKVRRVHIGTHGAEIHAQLRALFLSAGWNLVFDYAPDTHHQTELGSFTTTDGILTARNPAV